MRPKNGKKSTVNLNGRLSILEKNKNLTIGSIINSDTTNPLVHKNLRILTIKRG